MNTTPYTDDVRLAHTLADSVDRVAMARFTDHSMSVQMKDDGTPVTDADREIEQLIRAQLQRARIRDGVAGEESGTMGTTSRQWVIDPIDGTSNFVRGVPVWATLIALLDEGEPVVGLVSAPALQRRWWAAKGSGSYAGKSLARATRLEVSKVANIANSSLSYSDFAGWAENGMEQRFFSLAQSVKRTRAYGDFWSYCLVAEGAVDIAVDPQLNMHNVAALVPIVREAGGKITTFNGNNATSTTYSQRTSVLATNGALHSKAQGLLSDIGISED